MGGSPIDFHDEIAQSKTGVRRTRLDATRPRVLRRYEALATAYSIAGLGGVREAVWSDDDRDALQHCYTSTVSALEELKRLIKARQSEASRDMCPYCGIGAPSQFDHYLPKSRYPEFSVHAFNLVPCCGPCNGLKSETWLAGGARCFLNFYIDSLPTSPVLDVDVDWSVRKGKLIPVVQYHLTRPAGFGRASFALLEQHFEKLKLLDRYQEQSHSEYLALRDTAIARQARSVAQLRTFLRSLISLRTQTLGPLSWKLALYSALIAHRPFLADCVAAS